MTNWYANSSQWNWQSSDRYPDHSANRRKYLLTPNLIITLYISWVTLFILLERNKHVLNFTLCPISQLSPGQDTTGKMQNLPSDELILVQKPGIQGMPSKSMLNVLKQKTTLDNGITKIYSMPWGLWRGGGEGTWDLDSQGMLKSQLWGFLAVWSPANFISYQTQFDPM